MMKRILLRTGIIALVCSLICFLLSRWFWRVGGSVMDAEGSFYANAYRRYSIALKGFRIFLSAGVVLLVLEYLLSRRRS